MQSEYTIIPASENYSAEMVSAVGRLFLTCATAELSVRYQLARLHHHPAKATANSLILIGGMEISIMLEKIVVGAMLIKPECQKEISGICDKIRSGFQRRNDIAHNTAISGSGDHLELGIARVTSTGKVTTSKTFDTKQIGIFAHEIEQNVRHLSERLNDIGVARLPKLLALKQMPPEAEKPQTPLPTGQ